MSKNKELLEQTKTAIAKIERARAIHQFKRILDKIGLGDGTTRKPKAIAT